MIIDPSTITFYFYANFQIPNCFKVVLDAVRVVSRLVNSNFVYAKLLQQFSLLILLQFYFATKSLTDFVTFSKCNKIAY